MRGFCKKCGVEREFEFIGEFGGLDKWRCKECENIQISGSI